ncbi:hypothetical protein [Azospirillum palustre]
MCRSEGREVLTLRGSRQEPGSALRLNRPACQPEAEVIRCDSFLFVTFVVEGDTER